VNGRGLMLACVAIPLFAVPAVAQVNAETLIRMEREANGRCRGGSGDSQETWEACGARDAYGRVLAMLGWCYGRQGEAGYQMNWHRCQANSIRMQ
jgi:hypothetical protein